MFSRLLINTLAIVLLLINYAQANSLSTSDLEFTNETIFKLDCNSTKDDLFTFFDTLKESFEIDAQLTSYKSRNGKLMVLGIAFQERTQRATKFIIRSNSEINDLCIVINNVTQIVSYAGSCQEESASILYRDPVQEEKERKILTARVKRLKEYKQTIKEIFEKEDITVEYDKKADNQKQAAENARKESRRSRLNESSDGYIALSQAVNRQYNERKDSLKNIRDKKLELEKIKKEEIALQTKRRKDSLKKARFKKPEAWSSARDSVKKPVIITITGSGNNNSGNSQTESVDILKKNANIKKEDEQNTADVLAVMKQNNTHSNSIMAIDSNTIFFSGEQCTFKVYENRTFIYDQNKNTILSVNAPLGEDPTRGKVILKGVTYNFEFDGLALSVKNRDGYLIDKDGNLLNPIESFDRVTANSQFQQSHEFIITAQSRPADVRAVIQGVNGNGFQFLIQENVSNTTGAINYFAFKIDGKPYSFREYEGIPAIHIQLDVKRKIARVQTAE